jgi:hypothetical protein
MSDKAGSHPMSLSVWHRTDKWEHVHTACRDYTIVSNECHVLVWPELNSLPVQQPPSFASLASSAG